MNARIRTTGCFMGMAGAISLLIASRAGSTFAEDMAAMAYPGGIPQVLPTSRVEHRYPFASAAD